MNTTRIITISVNYDDEDHEQSIAVEKLVADFEDCVAKRDLELDNSEYEDI